MSKGLNWKKTNIDNYYYSPNENQNKYHRHYYNAKTEKINNFENTKTQKYNNYKKNNFSNENNCFIGYQEFDNCEAFYPKNFQKSKNQLLGSFNNDEQNTFSPKKNNDFSNYENSINNNNNYKNYEKNESQEEQIGNIKNSLNEQQNKEENEKIMKEEINEKAQCKKEKKFGIKSIPHPQRKKGSCYIPAKKRFPYQQKKEGENFFKKERKLSNSSLQTNYDSAKHSISTLNTSSSSYKEKDVLYEEKKSVNSSDNKTNVSDFSEYNNENKIIKNKFDENVKEKNQPEQINKYFENTVILNVNVKLPNNQTVIFKLRRYDDLFFTIKLFCEINSIEEKFIKPLIIKSLCAINTVYQIYNCPISSEDISLLQLIQNINDAE